MILDFYNLDMDMNMDMFAEECKHEKMLKFYLKSPRFLGSDGIQKLDNFS